MSCTGAWADGPGRSAEALLVEADTAMYQAKHGGGGRGRMAEELAARAQRPSA